MIGALDSGLRGDPYPGAVAMHVDKRCRVVEVDDNGGAGANVRYQLPREPPIVLYLVHACHKTGISVVGAALWRADLSEQDRSSWNASQASTAMITPRAVEQRRRDVNGQLRPGDSDFEWSRRSDRSDKSTHHHLLGVALDPAIAL